MKKTILLLIIILCFSHISYGENTYNTIYSFTIDGVITDATASFIEANIKKAEQDKVPVLMYIDTPGGVLESTRKIVQTLLSAKVPVISYVYPNGARAASAGIFITMAAEFSAMSESSNIGAANTGSSSG